jgi:tRNA G18 (ribose-2'-O)-methylase SpoU
MRGYFGIGVEGVSKAMNVGSLMRTAHAFDASFVFTIAETYQKAELNLADTSSSSDNMPFYRFTDVTDFRLPLRCQLVGVEITDDAIDLPSFHHPRTAAYVLGSERLGLSAEMIGLCDHIIKIPTRFSLNLALCGGLIMYDRLLSMGRFAPRATRPGGPTESVPVPNFGEPLWRRKKRRQQAKTGK